MKLTPSYHCGLHNKLRWAAMGVFVFSSMLNYLDRSLLTALGPLIRGEFGLSYTQFGWVISASSLLYAVASPFMGYLMDRFGLNRVITTAVGFWSLAGAATGLTSNLAGLVICRLGLGLGESAGIPAVAKAGAIYLPPEERALGSALSQAGLSAGGVLAPVAGTWLALSFGWRRPFLVAGALGLLWIPVWLAVSRKVRPDFEPRLTKTEVMWDPRLAILIVANVLWMGLYSLWSNWTTFYLVDVHHLTLARANQYAWVPPAASNLGALLGGWLALKWIAKGGDPVPARMRVILISALGSLLTLAVPFAPGPGWAMLAISVSYFWALAGSVNVYTIPVDLFGPERAGFSISALVFAYGLMQTAISPAIGWMVQNYGYAPVCWILAGTPLLAYWLLHGNLGGTLNFRSRE